MENSEETKDGTRESWQTGHGNAPATAPNGQKDTRNESQSVSVMTDTERPSWQEYAELLGILSDLQARLKLPLTFTKLDHENLVVVAIPKYGYKVDRVSTGHGTWVYTIDGEPIRSLEVMTVGHDTEKKTKRS